MLARVRTTTGSTAAFFAGLLLLNLWGGVALAVDKPDLVVTSVGNPPATALPGDTLQLSVTVANQGLGPANATASVTQISTKFYLVAGTSKKNLKFVQTVDLPFAAGATKTDQQLTLGVYSDTTPGAYTLQACADGDGDISETNENNNCTNAAAGIVVQDAPDLIISSISNPPSSGAQGQPITVKETVKNIGPVDADPTVTKYYLVSTVDGARTDLKLPSPAVPTPVVKKGSTFTEQQVVTVRPETEPGTYRLQACADANRVEAERDENNNCLTSTGIMTVAAVPDLIVTSALVQGAPLTVAPNDHLSITTVVRNDGGAKANKTSALKFILVNTANGAEKNLNGSATVPTLDGNTEVIVPANRRRLFGHADRHVHGPGLRRFRQGRRREPREQQLRGRAGYGDRAGDHAEQCGPRGDLGPRPAGPRPAR